MNSHWDSFPHFAGTFECIFASLFNVEMNIRLCRLEFEVINTLTSFHFFIFRGTLVDALTTMAYCSTLTKFFSHNTLKLPCSEIQHGLKHFLKERSVFFYTRAKKHLNGGDFFFIKISTQPCYSQVPNKRVTCLTIAMFSS